MKDDKFKDLNKERISLLMVGDLLKSSMTTNFVYRIDKINKGGKIPSVDVTCINPVSRNPSIHRNVGLYSFNYIFQQIRPVEFKVLKRKVLKWDIL